MSTHKTRTASFVVGTLLLAGALFATATPAAASEFDTTPVMSRSHTLTAQPAAHSPLVDDTFRAAVVTTNEEPAPWSRGRAGAWTLVFGGAALGVAAVGSYAFSRTQRRAVARS